MILSKNLDRPAALADPSKLSNPFVGLRAFEEHEDYLFFGRGAEINDLLKKFSNSRFLAVIGSSGSGKSSLVKSGLLPAIYSGFLSVGNNWRVALFRPGNDPIGNLAGQLAGEGVLYEKTQESDIPYKPIIESTLRRSGGGLIQAYRQAHLPATENLLIVIDQFEELFRFSRYEKETNEGKSDALGFINLLLTASQQKDYPVYVLITMRSDFLGDCAQFRGLPEAINEGQYLVPRMTRDEIREAITGPIAVSGAQIAPRLLTRVLNDVGNNLDQLPILQHAMMRTWDEWNKKNNPAVPIDIADYEKIGSMTAALSQHAEEAYAELNSDKQRHCCEMMFKSLTDKAADVRGIRRPTSIPDLARLSDATSAEIIEIVEVFRRPGRTFLMPPPDVPLNEQSIIDISHESIMRIWERLVKWIDEEAASAEVYLRISEASRLYKEGKTDLWRNPELAIGLKWYQNNNPNAFWADRYDKNFEQSIDFLLKSEERAIQLQKEKERAAQFRKNVAIGAIIILSLIAIGAFISTLLVNNARKEARRQEELAVKNEKAAITARIEADTSAARASRAKIEADSNAARAVRAEASALKYAEEATLARDSALKAQEKAEAERKRAEDLLLTTIEQNKNIAASEYQRLIREGPTEKDSIISAFWNFKYYAYSYHLDSLRNKLGVQRAVQKNDELYNKLYFSLLSSGQTKAELDDNRAFVINQVGNADDVPAGWGTGNYSLGNSSQATMGIDHSSVAITNPGWTDDIIIFQSKISAMASNEADKCLLIATEDNTLTVRQYDALGAFTENKIPMGGQVTALDYYEGHDVIFFGLKTGEVGYIKYDNQQDSKNQPVYRNELDAKATAIDFFVKNEVPYLLATSSKGQAVVYELGSTTAMIEEFLKENKTLTGIALPETVGEIKSAGYLPDADRILLQTNKNAYHWNPFVNELSAKLKAELNEDPKDQATLEKIIANSTYY